MVIPPGAAKYISEACEVGVEAAHEDCDEESESYKNSEEVDAQQSAGERFHLAILDTSTKRHKGENETLYKNAKAAAANVVVTQTLKDYKRLWRQFTDFCIEMEWIESTDKWEEASAELPTELPTWIVVWISDKCDDRDMYTALPKDPGVHRATYSHAQKMRTAISHKFGRDFGLGAQPWQQNPLTEKFLGNPSVSVLVGQYMISLRHRKVRSGEVVTSARAIDEATMKKLWEYNMTFPKDEYGPTSRKRKFEHPEDWGGSVIRIMLQLLFLVSMLCLLRYDEALHIIWGDVHFETLMNGVQRVRLDLPFRKTHQNGGIAPFYLYANPDHPWMCPVRAFALWWRAMADVGNGTPQGYVFRKKVGRDGFGLNPMEGMSSESFLECFRNNLLDLGIDPRMYGTHSFRRGGCQYLAMVLRWPFRNICTWGGWAEHFDNPGTIFKYLLSWTDEPLLQREDYFNPNREGSDPCSACGRTCHCA